MAQRSRYFYDLHTHTNRYSACSRIAPEEAIRIACNRGLDGIALTEHGILWTPEEIEELRAKVGYHSFTVLAGCEVSTWSGDRQIRGCACFRTIYRS